MVSKRIPLSRGKELVRIRRRSKDGALGSKELIQDEGSNPKHSKGSNAGKRKKEGLPRGTE